MPAAGPMLRPGAKGRARAARLLTATRRASWRPIGVAAAAAATTLRPCLIPLRMGRGRYVPLPLRLKTLRGFLIPSWLPQRHLGQGRPLSPATGPVRRRRFHASRIAHGRLARLPCYGRRRGVPGLLRLEGSTGRLALGRTPSAPTTPPPAAPGP